MMGGEKEVGMKQHRSITTRKWLENSENMWEEGGAEEGEGEERIHTTSLCVSMVLRVIVGYVYLFSLLHPSHSFLLQNPAHWEEFYHPDNKKLKQDNTSKKQSQIQNSQSDDELVVVGGPGTRGEREKRGER